MTSARVETKRITDLPKVDLEVLLAESEKEGFDFVRRVVKEWGSGANRFDGAGEALFSQEVDGATVGICGLMLDPYCQKVGVGRLRNLYVLPAFRRAGVGASLTRVVTAAARQHFHTLRLRAGTDRAARLYDRLGFERVSRERDCTHRIDFV